MFKARIKSYPKAEIFKFQFPSLEEEKIEEPQQVQVVQDQAGDDAPESEVLPSNDDEPEVLPSEDDEPEVSPPDDDESEVLPPDGDELEVLPSNDDEPEVSPSFLPPPPPPPPPSPPERSLADIEKEAHEKGFEEGFEKGRSEGAESVEKEATELLLGLRAAVASVRELRERVVREAEPQVVELAIAIARRVLIGELSENPERIVEIVKEAIRRIERVGAVTIRVHPDLSDTISSLKGRSSEFQADILLDIDSSVPLYGPVVVGATEEVHTGIDEQIRVIEEELRSARAAY